MSTTTTRSKTGGIARATPITTQLECSLRATVDAVNLAQSDPASPAALRQELEQILSDGHDRTAMLAAAMALACRASGALLAAYFQRDEQGQLALLAEHRDPRLDPALVPDRAALEQGAALACSRCAVQVARLQSRNSAVAVPLGTSRDPIGAVSLLLPTVEMPLARQANVEMLLAWLATWLCDESRRQAAWEARTTAAIIELSLAIAKAGNLRQACLVLAGDAQAHLSCRQVAVGLRRGERMRVAAVSGLAEVQCDTELSGVLENCLDEVLLHDQAIVWPPAAHDVPSAWPAHRQLAAATGARALASATLRTADGRVVGAWVLVADEPFAEPEHTARALAAAAEPIGASLDAVAHRRRITWVRLLALAGLCGWRKLLAPAAAVGLVFAVPLPYRISCSFQLEPVTRRYVAAPFEGIFEKSLVKPGDMVTRGQLLGRMDGRSWNSTLERIGPRAELRETDNVFVAEAPLANDSEQLRPGMKGTATVYGPRRSLFWIAFHKPWNYLANWLSWQRVEHGGSDYVVRDHLSAVVRLRADLVISPQPGGLEPGYLIEDPLRGRFFHVGISEFTVLSLLDGRHTVGEALSLAARSLGSHALGEQEVLAICQWLMDAGLAHTDASAQSGRVAQALERVVRQRRLARLNPLAIRIPLANPDRALAAAMPWLGWLTSPACFAAWCVVMAWAGWIVVRDWRQLADAPLVLLDPAGGLRLLAAWVGLKLWHETLHALFCKKYGGRVSNAGVMLLCLTPVAYVDVTSSWRFRSRWQRMATAAAGMYGECLAGGLALIAWSRLAPGGPRHLAYCVSLMALAHTLLFNANPLMRFDGYYILSDWCGVPNLAQRGSQYLAALFSQVVLGMRVPLPAWPARIGRLVRLYALAALAWRVMVYTSLALFLIGWLSYAGGLLAAAMFMAAAAPPLRRAWQKVRQPGWPAALDWRRVAISGMCAAAMLCGLLATMCRPGLVRVPGVVEYTPLVIVRAASPGFVRELRVADGALVSAGQVLLVLENEDLARKARDLALELEQATIQSRLHHQSHELAKYQAQVAQCQALKKKLAEARAEAGQLVIRAVGDGRLIARGFDQLAGRYLAAGQEIGAIGDQRSKEVRLAIDHEDVDLVADQIGRQVTVRVGGAAPRHLAAKLVRVEPQGATDLPHPALSAQVGGPLPVKPKEPAEGQPAETYELLSPAFAGIAALPADEAAGLLAGQRVNLAFRSPGETVAGRLRRVLLHWIDAQIAKGQAANR